MTIGRPTIDSVTFFKLQNGSSFQTRTDLALGLALGRPGGAKCIIRVARSAIAATPPSQSLLPPRTPNGRIALRRPHEVIYRHRIPPWNTECSPRHITR